MGIQGPSYFSCNDVAWALWFSYHWLLVWSLNSLFRVTENITKPCLLVYLHHVMTFLGFCGKLLSNGEISKLPHRHYHWNACSIDILISLINKTEQMGGAWKCSGHENAQVISMHVNIGQWRYDISWFFHIYIYMHGMWYANMIQSVSYC